MKNDGLDSFEHQLRRLTPSDPPPALMERLARDPGRPVDACDHATTAAGPATALSRWRWWVRWLVPAAATMALAVLYWKPAPEDAGAEPQVATAPGDGWMPEEIEVDRQLVAAFEGVACLPDGIPFRFRCYNWDEELVARDASGRVEVRQRAPRMEIVPTSLAVY
jgi:hypothetical protein